MNKILIPDNPPRRYDERRKPTAFTRPAELAFNAVVYSLFFAGLFYLGWYTAKYIAALGEAVEVWAGINGL